MALDDTAAESAAILMASLKKLLVVQSCIGYDLVQEYTFEHVGRASVYRATPGLCTEGCSAY